MRDPERTAMSHPHENKLKAPSHLQALRTYVPLLWALNWYGTPYRLVRTGKNIETQEL